MINELEVSIRKPRSAEDYQQTISEVLATAQEMENILEDLLLLARMEAGQKSLDLRPVNLRHMIDESWNRLQNEGQGEAATKSGASASSESKAMGQSFPPGIKFYNEIDPAIVIRADSNQLRRAWLNLLKNAINYNEPDGEIRIRADRQDDKVVVTVSNTGPGIPPDKLPFIFDRFYRASHYYSEAGGAGLGLSIAKAIIELYGGTIRASSQPGLTTFEITLPL